MGFLPSKIHQGHMQGWEYLPCGSIQPHVGMALYLSSGVLAIAEGATKPEYISMIECSAALTSGTKIPVIKVLPDALYDVPTYNTLAERAIGSKVQIQTGGMMINSTNSSSPAVEIVDKNGAGTSANDIITVRIP